MGSVLFASEVYERQDPDIRRWPGVYVHPGEFKPAAANVEGEGETWIRYRDRYRRLRAHCRLPKAERFAAAPGMSTAEQDGTSIVHQTITCHYHVYAPTTIHVNSSEARCITESSSEVATATTLNASISERPIQTDGALLTEIKLGTNKALQPSKSEGKKEAILRWLIIKLTLLLVKVSNREKCVVPIQEIGM
ncbi:hypothetical protein E8E12_004943 [Didymella heteroderae]|uniref:Uncharacterized protein n=1 Tax=Didymella heteroderae TaxID=1769908 RepID=A0A9P5BX26_9PLEO|nr:hypothetical protein E8E12_004943 [Didymella heteroderae]